ncbi:YceK/YidQ family lipoprotein [Erwinia sp. 198]|uniref:YceK/YidQ family lipoprotein n=1 Tax=Erwinia sp. 198 TaxID=2022746 RepID=UPI000F6837E3|nr:YceK/YidQ family lipoprotein [Erwinia sp. 198]RRZ91535.1 YceK/YidQ family lipoprotein [Erwinia sp. 198]
MMVLKKSRFAGLLACLLLVGTGGCSSFMSHSGPDQGYYPGTRASAKIVTDSDSGWVMRPLAAIDLPFSAVLDTLLLPFDYYRSGRDKTGDSPRERVLRSEQQNHTSDSLSQAAPLVINTSPRHQQ